MGGAVVYNIYTNSCTRMYSSYIIQYVCIIYTYSGSLLVRQLIIIALWVVQLYTNMQKVSHCI